MPWIKYKSEYGLTAHDRAIEIARKFGSEHELRIMSVLSKVAHPSEKILGAIIYVARPGHADDIQDLVDLANKNPAQLLNAATVKEERS